MRVKMKTIFSGKIGKVENAYLAAHRLSLFQALVKYFSRFFPGTEFFADNRYSQGAAGSFENKSRLCPKGNRRSVIYFQQGNVNKEKAGTDPECQRLCQVIDTYPTQQIGGDAIFTMGSL